ncbi:MAG TPA: methyl-accepting chemotaxis protein [Opitutaceae bacterium]|nr:methyl-accepting chemotaxis protein [Opitutaceae bacterium]
MKSLTLGAKVMLGFGSVTAIAVALGAVGYYGAERNDAAITDVGRVRFVALESVLNLKEAATSLKSVQRTLMQRDLDEAMRKRQYDLADEARKTIAESLAAYEKLPHTAEEDALYRQLTPVLNEWLAADGEFLRLARELDALRIGDPILLERDLATFRGQHYELQVKVLKACNNGELFEGGADHTACAFGRWRAAHRKVENTELAAALGEIDSRHQAFHEAAGRAKSLVAGGDRDGAKRLVFGEMERDAAETFALFGRMLQLGAEATARLDALNNHALAVCRPPQLKTTELLEKLAQANAADTHDTTLAAIRFGGVFKTICLAVAASGLLLAAVLAFTITRSIARGIRSVVDSLSGGADHVVSAAAQVASASQSLAQGVSEQAASLEETSASIEEMSSMTNRNAANAEQANALAKRAREAAERGGSDIQAMSTAMGAIKASSSDIAKIIKTIDEIAFQTNILALNAAVEAARAGEAGAGFAVVAEEVRALAQRSAQAAKETSDQIETAIRNTDTGAQLTEHVAGAFSEIVEQVRQVDQLVAEVANASREQSQGVKQVGTAVVEMDKVTQSSAASAEESASAAEELNAQAISMRESVGKLLAMIEGERAKAHGATAASNVMPKPGTAKAARGTAMPRKPALPVPASVGAHDSHFADL